MNDMFTDRVRRVMENAALEAQKQNSESIDSEHLLLGMLNDGGGVAIALLNNLMVDLDELRTVLEEAIGRYTSTMVLGTIPFSDNVKQIIAKAQMEAESLSYKYVGTEHLLLAMLKLKESPICDTLLSFGLSYEKVKKELLNINKENTSPGRTQLHTKTPSLEKFGRDLTQLARENLLDPVIGRDDEIHRVTLILSRRKKNNPILLGEPGVGKTAIVEGVAQRIIQHDVSENLKNKRIISLDMGSIVAGTKFRGQFEERIKSILTEIVNSGNIIVFLDEIHTLIGAGGSEGSLDAANMLKPMLARGEMQCIGATTADEFKRFIEKDGALERRFQPIMIDPPSVDDTVRILEGLVGRYESFHQVRYDNESLKAAAILSDRYINDRFLPDKALDVIDEAGALLHIRSQQLPPEMEELEKKLVEVEQHKQQAIHHQDYEQAARLRDSERTLRHEIETSRKEWNKYYTRENSMVTQEVVREVVSQITSIPVQQLSENSSNRLLLLEKELNRMIVGQSEAVKSIVNTLKRSQAGFRDRLRPIGSFIFLGPSGVGKTYTAVTLARLLFGKEEAIVRLDMTEYMEKFNVSRLIGAPPGYVGFQEGGQLTERIRKKPHSIVLFDEIEKAHPDIHNILLQVLDTGILSDANGRKVNFRNTIIILTSNIGMAELASTTRMGFNKSDGLSQRTLDSYLRKELKKTFKPELLNRFDDIIVFNRLSRQNMETIADLLFDEIRQRAAEKAIRLNLSEKARQFLAHLEADEEGGARYIKHSIQSMVEDLLSEKFLKGEIKQGDSIQVDVERDHITIGKT
ncbi:MAG: ATP-dependent Clp protease ATP-binding subunit [Candidatus Delongbacteria bacterium]|nr:ATP-dependent Clp protease ATP-binding subunit [Candidatus Delongbacteria bacterium]